MSSDTKPQSDEMAEIRANIDKLTKDISALSANLADILKSRVSEAGAGIREGVKSTAAEINEKSKASKDAIEHSIRERPFQSILVAFGAGLLIAQVFRKHHSS